MFASFEAQLAQRFLGLQIQELANAYDCGILDLLTGEGGKVFNHKIRSHPQCFAKMCLYFLFHQTIWKSLEVAFWEMSLDEIVVLLWFSLFYCYKFIVTWLEV